MNANLTTKLVPNHNWQWAAIALALFAIVGYPLAILVAADGAPVLAVGVYLAASAIAAIAANLWIASDILHNDEPASN